MPSIKEIGEAKKSPTLRYKRDRDREMVRGIFRYPEIPGGVMSFVFKLYKEDEVERFDLIDGHTYSLPIGVAKHLANNCWYPIHKHIETEESGIMLKIGDKVRRTGFQSLEFVDIEDLNQSPDITTVEKVVLK